jgi:hypothetical protein
MPVINTLTLESLRDVSRRLDAAQTADEARQIMADNYRSLGWKRIGQLFALQYDPDAMFAADQDKVAKAGTTDGS